MIHPSHQPEARRAFVGVALLFVLLVVAMLLPESVRVHRISDYLPLHMALETLAIVIASFVFGIVWSTRREHLPGGILLLGTAFLGVMLLDFSHMLSSAGMPAWVTPSSSQKAIYFWLAARSLGVLALLGAAWLPWWAGSVGQAWGALLGVLGLVALVHAGYFLAPDRVPAFFTAEGRLSALKVGYEWALVALCLVAALRYGMHLRRERRFHAAGLFATACVMAESGVFFSRFGSVTDVTILLGHLYKVAACLFLYRAVFDEAVKRPYVLLRESRGRMRATLEAMPDLLFEMDDDGRYLEVHAGRTGELSAVREYLLGRTAGEVLPEPAAREVLAAIAEARADGISRGRTILLPVLETGNRHWFELSVARKAVVEGMPSRYVIISRDITQRRRTEYELRKLSSAVSQSPVSIIITDVHGRIEFINPAFTRTTGWSAEEALGQDSRALLWSGKTSETIYRTMLAELESGRSWQGEFVNRTRSGREVIERVLIYPLRNEEGEVTHYLAHHEDITASKRAAERIQQLSHYDQLTGLPNRGMLGEHFRYARARGATLALLWIDLDRFKDVNDSLGHATGDQLLQEMAHRLQARLGAEALLSRHAADEFVAIVPDTDQATIARLTASLLPALSLPLELAGQDVSITVSVGIALCPDDAGELDGLLKSAEIAMYRAKEEGRNGYCFFAPEMQDHAARTLALGNALKQALARGELALAWQPQVALAGEAIVGAEALLRWCSPQWGQVSPAEFIPIAEANGLIVPIGEWVLRTALAQVRAWFDAGLPPIVVAVNLSAVQFNQPDIAGRIGALVEAGGVPPECLELELTEAVAMRAPERAARTIEELRRRRIRIAIDDFGTGYSSLSYLKQFRVNKIKIDQSFVRDIGIDQDDQAIVIAVIQMAKSLGMRTIAEGVETAEQLTFLNERECDEVQGYYYSRPLPASEFEAFVRARCVIGGHRAGEAKLS